MKCFVFRFYTQVYMLFLCLYVLVVLVSETGAGSVATMSRADKEVYDEIQEAAKYLNDVLMRGDSECLAGFVHAKEYLEQMRIEPFRVEADAELREKELKLYDEITVAFCVA